MPTGIGHNSANDGRKQIQNCVDGFLHPLSFLFLHRYSLDTCRSVSGIITHMRGNAMNMSFTDYVSTTWNFLFTRNDRTSDTVLPVKQVDLSHFANRDSDQLNVTWLGHSSLMINIIISHDH